LHIYADEGVKLSLHDNIREWQKFLEGKAKKIPKPILRFDLEYKRRTIPPVYLIERALGKMNYVRTIMDSNGKWRKRRNSIAHNALHFGSEETYKEYKHDLLNAINQLQRHAAKHKNT